MKEYLFFAILQADDIIGSECLPRLCMLSHWDLRAVREPPRLDLTGPDGCRLTRCRENYTRDLATIFGDVVVKRKGYSAAGVASRFPLDGELNLSQDKCLRGAGEIGTAVEPPTAQDPALLTAFCEWMRQQRGTCDPTLCNYSLPIRELLKRFDEAPDRFDAKSLRQFVLERSQQCGWAAAKTCTTALRMFLRFLIAEGKCPANLHTAIPVLAHWHLSSLFLAPLGFSAALGVRASRVDATNRLRSIFDIEIS